MLTFNLTYYYFDLIVNDYKRFEARPINSYWSKRIMKLNPGDKIKIVRGYTSKNIIVKTVAISSRDLKELSIEDDLKKIYGDKYERYFIIEFQLNY
jgi:hypothetical protein